MVDLGIRVLEREESISLSMLQLEEMLAQRQRGLDGEGEEEDLKPYRTCGAREKKAL